MKKKKSLVLNISLYFFFLSLYSTHAQLGFCGGNSGEAIFTENFGTGTTNGPQLPAGTTTYNFVTGTPNDGSYTISSSTNYFDWFNSNDHTPGDTNGKSLIVNASFTAGEFYQRRVTGLCENTTYEFSSWLINLLPATTACPNGGIPINVRFQILDSSGNAILAQGDTGNIIGTLSPDWNQFGLVFTTRPGQTAIILKMLNNGIGGCGNDLAIDDISFKTCGDFVSLTDNANNTFLAQCENAGPISTTLTAKPDFAIFNSHAYQ